jgi:hypothetical protein
MKSFGRNVWSVVEDVHLGRRPGEMCKLRVRRVVYRLAPHVWQNQPVPSARLTDSEGNDPSPGQLGP